MKEYKKKFCLFVIVVVTAKNLHIGLKVYMHDLHVNVHYFNDSILACLSSILTFSMLKDNRILKLWRYKLFELVFECSRMLLLAFQFLLLLTTFYLLAFVGDEYSQNFCNWYTGWTLPDGNIKLILEKQNKTNPKNLSTYWDGQGKVEECSELITKYFLG